MILIGKLGAEVQELIEPHVGHELTVVRYEESVAVECLTCEESLIGAEQ